MTVDARHSRQDFLGRDAPRLLRTLKVGVVGLGGGGSHVVQQLAHVGFRRYALFDGDRIEKSNLNRLVSGTVLDAWLGLSKRYIAKRAIRRVQPDAHIEAYACRWQDKPEALSSCDVVVGCVDGFAQRRELEAAARRHHIPYVDIGLDVHQDPNGVQPPRMSGHVILSMPGQLCMQCMQLLSEANLAKEAARYGDAGIRPQVVWANGVLASTAVGLVVDLVTGWTQSLNPPVYLSYESNVGVVQPHPRLPHLPKVCVHYPLQGAGAPRFVVL